MISGVGGVFLTFGDHMTKGRFIAFEGIDGSGKSTQAKLLAERLQQRGLKVHLTFEPTKSYIGSILRSILTGERKADPRTVAALFLADRMDHLTNEQDGILRLLDEGYVVIMDRYYFSSYAYHSMFMDMDWVIAANKICADALRPDMTIYLEMDPKEAMDRIKANREGTELYETQDLLEKVHANYAQAFGKLGGEEKWVSVGAMGAVAQISAEIDSIVDKVLGA